MSCRRIRRELIERFRFGELDERSAPHLAHLHGCVDCRDEVGLDRTVVRHLQRALSERVVGHDPSPNAFEGIRQRALAPAPAWGDGLWRWARALPAGAAIALMGFAVLSGSSGLPRRRSRGRSRGQGSRSARRSMRCSPRAGGSRATSCRRRRRAA